MNVRGGIELMEWISCYWIHRLVEETVVVVANIMTALKLIGRRNHNNALKAENDKIRCENKAIREALKHAICLNCGGPPVSEDPYFDEHKLRIENAHFRDEVLFIDYGLIIQAPFSFLNLIFIAQLKRMSTVAPNYMGRPISSHLSTLHPMHISPLDLSMAGASLDFDLLPGSYMHYQPNNLATISDMDKPLMNDIALTAMEELLRLF
ncbi:hypothetical protein HID58_067978 [Brassica napus]|uniref:Uncharacterized protein n=1 Tax=Brassica napus TaxID=3708 RepID=A0ABQ7ZK47_BRANA|nr:hypothetical protein HID58_067978 [Brassica napus]